jgi:hypothetical protein
MRVEELVKRVAADTGIDSSIARKSVIVILKFLSAEGPPDKVAKLVDAIPGAAESLAGRTSAGGGVMGVFDELTVAGLGMGDIQSVARSFVAFAREKVGAETVDDVVGSIPGLSQFI